MNEPDLTREEIEHYRELILITPWTPKALGDINAIFNAALRASEARAQALEEAARFAEEACLDIGCTATEAEGIVRRTRTAIAAAIRALKDQSVSDDAAARRKLEALREPTEEMLDAAYNEMQEPPWIRGVEKIDVRRIYRAMIDAAIREKQ